MIFKTYVSLIEETYADSLFKIKKEVGLET